MASASAPTVGNHFVNLNSCIYSGSTFLGVQNVNQSNVNPEMNSVEKHARKVVFGVLGNAALIVASAIEALARAIFGVGALIYGYASSAPEERKDFFLRVGFMGMVLSAGNAYACAKAIYAICSNWNGVAALNYNNLYPEAVCPVEETLREMFAQPPARPANGEAGAAGNQADQADNSVATPPASAPKQETPAA